MTREDAIHEIRNANVTLVSKEAKEIAIEALEQEPCEDCISRWAVCDTTVCYGISCNECSFNTCEDGQSGCLLIERISKLPSVTPQPKYGKWIYDRTRDWDGECKYECSECGMGSDVDYAYCMRCGAKMEVSK